MYLFPFIVYLLVDYNLNISLDITLDTFTLPDYSIPIFCIVIIIQEVQQEIHKMIAEAGSDEEDDTVEGGILILSWQHCVGNVL